MGQPDAAALLSLAESIADGSSIDWDAVEARAAVDDQGVIRQLRVLADLATLHRTLPASADADAFAARRTAAAPAIGRWAHLDLIERIGGGTFGDVYRAWDRHLECEVALKLLHATGPVDDPFASRIVTEGRLLARARHANVVAVHGVAVHDGRVGLWMELVDGPTLEQLLQRNGPFSAREAALIGIDLCRALAAIHLAGLAHRDVKTQNVVREQGGRIVLMDLGTGRELDPTRPVLSDLAGTPLYLAPEIFEGASASERTDLYSLGVLLYRLVTGAFPVRAATIDALRAAHAKHATVHLRDARPDLPTAFVRVVDRAIASDLEKRYASAGEFEAGLIEALEQEPANRIASASGHGLLPPRYRRSLLVALAAAAIMFALMALPWSIPFLRRAPALDPRAIRSIAVLPLANLSGDPSQEYFADGMTEALIDQLAKLRALRIISRTSAMQFKGTTKSLRDVATLLNVDAVLEGSIVKSGDRVRVSADLVHVPTERHVWVDSFDGNLGDLLALQADVAQRIAREIQIQLTPQEQAGFGFVRPANAAAEEAYLQGRYYWNKRTDDGFQKALDYFRRAASIDPSFARAYAGQADVYILAPGRMSPLTAYPLAKDAANHALALDPTLAEAHTSLAFASFIFDRDWATAEAGFKRAIAFNPGYATAHQWYGEFLSAMGRSDEALAQLELAASLDPLSATLRSAVGDALYMAHRFDEAIANFGAGLKIGQSDSSTYIDLSLAYAKQRRFDEADAVLSSWSAQVGSSSSQKAVAAAVSAMRGDSANALRAADELVSHGRDIDTIVDLAAYPYIYLGHYDRAFQLLARAEQAMAPGLLWAKVDPVFDPLRGDARFDALLARLHLAQ